MEPKLLKKELLTKVGERLSVFGFGKNPKGQVFHRPKEDGWDSVHITIINHSDGFDITVDVSVRFNEVEDLVNSNKSYLSEREKKKTATLGVELGNLSAGEQRRWAISSENQIPTVVGSVIDMYKKYGEPYLLKYSSIDSAYKLLSRDDSSVWMHCPIHQARAKKAIAIAKIQNHPDIQSQIERRKKFLENQNDFSLSDFVEFIKYISR